MAARISSVMDVGHGGVLLRVAAFALRTEGAVTVAVVGESAVQSHFLSCPADCDGPRALGRGQDQDQRGRRRSAARARAWTRAVRREGRRHRHGEH